VSWPRLGAGPELFFIKTALVRGVESWAGPELFFYKKQLSFAVLILEQVLTLEVVCTGDLGNCKKKWL